MIYTSCFASAGKHPKAVAISRGVPVWFRNRRIYDALRPSWAMLKLGEDTRPPNFAAIVQTAAVRTAAMAIPLANSAIQ